MDRIALVIIAVITVSVVGCNDTTHRNETATPTGIDSRSTLLRVDLSQLDWGVIHNVALSRFHNRYSLSDFSAFGLSDGEEVFALIHRSTIESFDSLGIVGSANREWLSYGLSLLEKQWEDSIMRRPADVPLTLDSRQYLMSPGITRILDHLNGSDYDLSSVSRNEFRDRLRKLCDSVIDAHNASGTTKTEVAFAQIARESAEYWYQFDDHRWGGRLGTSAKLAAAVQIDCGGYIYGWVTAVIVEHTSTGQLSSKNENTRIAAGAAMAVNASCGGTVKIARGIASWVRGLW